MQLEELAGPIRTAHLELVALTAPFVHGVVAADRAQAEAEIAASVGIWLTSDPAHVVQLHLAALAAEADGFPGLGRAIVLIEDQRARHLIGTIGFHGPPDERGRLEISCRIHPARQSRGYGVEALSAMLDWAAVRYGASRFLLEISTRRERLSPVPLEIAVEAADGVHVQIAQIARLLES